MIERAADTGCLGLVVTVDQPTVGIRYRDRRNQFKSPSNFRLQNVLTEAEFKALRPREGAVQRFLEQQRQAAVTWKDIEWLRSISKMPVILKGILSPTDAKLAASAGASGIIVSNHGGRQLDALVSPVAALPAVREAVGRDFPLIVDGGIRSGSDIIRCLCLGANAVMIGRPAVWGLAADGESGALAVLRLLAEEFTKGIAILGANSLAELGREYIFRHSAFSYPKTF
jgi:4-hydroxymandelate oxidase